MSQTVGDVQIGDTDKAGGGSLHHPTEEKSTHKLLIV